MAIKVFMNFAKRTSVTVGIDYKKLKFPAPGYAPELWCTLYSLQPAIPPRTTVVGLFSARNLKFLLFSDSSVLERTPVLWCFQAAGNRTQNIKALKVKVKVELEVYSLVFSAKRHSPDFTPVTGPVHSQAISTPWGAYSPAAISAHGSSQPRRPSLSQQVPTKHLGVHVWAKCLA